MTKYSQLSEDLQDEYKKYFRAVMKKFGVKSPADIKDDQKKKDFFNAVDKYWTNDKGPKPDWAKKVEDLGEAKKCATDKKKTVKKVTKEKPMKKEVKKTTKKVEPKKVVKKTVKEGLTETQQLRLEKIVETIVSKKLDSKKKPETIGLPKLQESKLAKIVDRIVTKKLKEVNK